MFLDDQPIIQAYGAASPEQTYKVLEFVIATANRKFAMVPQVLATGRGFTDRQRTSLAFLYAGRGMVYDAIQARHENPVELMMYLVSLPGLGIPKAGFAAQLLTGQVGCMDVWNLKQFQVPKQIMRIDNVTETTLFTRLFQYCGICAKLGTAFLWDNWCATLASQYKPCNAVYPWQTAQEVSTFHLECLGLA